MGKKEARVGCCGFAKSHDEYFQTFPLIEIQKTFYQPPQEKTATRWREDEAPEGFEFTLKAWQLITHEASSPTYRRLNRDLGDREKAEVGSFRWTDTVREAWEATRTIARLLEADKVVFQCPASFEPAEENQERLRRFFTGIDRAGLTCIWEPRGSWEAELIGALCENLGLVHCVDPFQDEAVTEGLRYYRLHGIGGYSHEHTDEELQELLSRRAEDAATYFLFNNRTMFDDARRLQAMLDG